MPAATAPPLSSSHSAVLSSSATSSFVLWMDGWIWRMNMVHQWWVLRTEREMRVKAEDDKEMWVWRKIASKSPSEIERMIQLHNAFLCSQFLQHTQQGGYCLFPPRHPYCVCRGLSIGTTIVRGAASATLLMNTFGWDIIAWYCPLGGTRLVTSLNVII